MLPDDPTPFDAPWELRAFALAVASHREGHFEWPTFQGELAAAVRRREESGEDWDYYACWVEALETVLDSLGVDGAATDAVTARILATPRDAEHQRARRAPVAVDPG